MRTRLVAVGVVLVVGSLTLTGCSAPEQQQAAAKGDTIVMKADYPAYDGASQAAADSDLIIQGSYVDSHVTLLRPEDSTDADPLSNPQAGADPSTIDADSMSVVVTVSTVRVDAVVKGDVAVGDVVEVSQLGGTYDGTTYEEESTTLLPDLDSSVVLLLAQTSDDGFDLINPEQGLLIDDGGSLESTGGEEAFDDVTTLDALREVAETH